MTDPCISNAALAAELGRGPEMNVLLFDVRAFFSHENGHVRGPGVNIGLPRTLTRRKRVGLKELEAIIRKEHLAAFRARETYQFLVVYDGGVVGSPGSVRPAAVLADLLRAERVDSPHTVHLLEGSYKEFEAMFPELCEVATEAQAQARAPGELSVHIPSPPPCAWERGPSEVKPRVFLGSAKDSADWGALAARNITHVVNVATECTNHFPDAVAYANFAFLDHEGQDLSTHLAAAARCVAEALESGGAVLVHCYAGVSRSATVVLAYLVEHCGMPLKDAYAHVLSCRPDIAPNAGFLLQLAMHEIKVRGSCSLREDTYGPLIKAAREAAAA